MSGPISLLLVAFLSTPATRSLDEAVTCYEALDYACAESRLAEALSSDLTVEQRIQAHFYEALVASAWRNPERAKRAVRAIYGLDPAYQPVNPPPNLAILFQQEKPKPTPPPSLILGLDYRLSYLTDGGTDTDWWQPGQGAVASVGLETHKLYSLSIEFVYSQHQVRDNTLGVNGLDRWSLDVLVGRATRLGKLMAKLGGSVGLTHVSTDVGSVFNSILDTTATDPFTAVQLGLNFGVYYPVYAALGLNLGFSPRVMVRNYEDQPRLSYLLPIQVGLRYGRE